MTAMAILGAGVFAVGYRCGSTVVCVMMGMGHEMYDLRRAVILPQTRYSTFVY